MRRYALFLLAALAAADDFEISAGKDWEALKPEPEGVKALYRTEFAGSEPLAYAEVRVMTSPLSEAHAEKALDAIAHDWAGDMERPFKDPKSVTEGASKLGDRDAWCRDVRTESARLTWYVCRTEKLLFVFHVIRTNMACEDADLEAEIATMREKFRFLEKEEAPATPGKPGEKPAPPKPPPVEPKKTFKFDHWRLEFVKPLGLASVPAEKFDEAERKAGIFAKFEGKKEQAKIVVRLYAQSRASQKFTVDQLIAQKIERFKEVYAESARQEPKRDDDWKCPLAERAVMLELTGRKGSVQTTRWYLAQCKNDRQYQMEIYFTGGDDAWAETIKEIVDGFRPVKG